jgi:predicted Zn-dependent protease
MSDFFDGLGRRAADAVAKVKWTYSALAGTEEEARAAERELGIQMATTFLEEGEVHLTKDPISKPFREIGKTLHSCLTDRNRNFEFGCLASEVAQAITFPGGFVFVSTGLLELCNGDENAIAGVIGHEMGHVVKNHAFERAMASQMVKLLSAGTVVGGPVKRTLMGLISRWLEKGYGEDQELEADVFAARIAYSAGFHPAGLIHFLSSLKPEVLVGPYWETHPDRQKRIRNLKEAF